jgi:hypothetical protein
MSIISYDSEQEVARVPVGDHPQRARVAKVSTAIFGAPAKANRARAKSLTLHVELRAVHRFRLSGRLRMPADVSRAVGCRGVVRLDLRRANKVVARAPARLRSTRSSCVYARTLHAPGRRLVAHARFSGNAALLPLTAR